MREPKVPLLESADDTALQLVSADKHLVNTPHYRPLLPDLEGPADLPLKDQLSAEYGPVLEVV